MARRSAQQWNLLIQQWRKSGLRRAEFARIHAVSPQQLSVWRWKLARRKPVTFLEFRLSQPSSPFVITLPSGLQLQVPPDFDDRELRRILEVLC